MTYFIIVKCESFYSMMTLFQDTYDYKTGKLNNQKKKSSFPIVKREQKNNIKFEPIND